MNTGLGLLILNVLMTATILILVLVDRGVLG